MFGRLKQAFVKETRPPGKIEKPVFIVGCGRSGTTMLFDILKRHPQLVPTTGYPDGEDHEGWVKHGRCLISGLGDPRIEGGHTGFHYCLHMNEQDATAEIIDAMTAHYRQLLSGDDSKRLVNKCPHLSNKLRYVRAIFPDAKFVHIVRDCLPVVSSWVKIMEAVPRQVLYWPETKFPCLWVLPAPPHGATEVLFRNEDRIFPGKGMALLADYWSTVNRNIPTQLADCPDQLLTVKYEDVCDRPDETLRRICDFCELPPFAETPLQIHRGYNEKYRERLSTTLAHELLERVSAARAAFGYR